MLRHRHGGEGGLAAHQRRRVRCGDHHHRVCQARLPQIVFEEFPHLPPPFADQGEHRDIAVRMARQHRQQGGLADAGAGEQAEPLAAPAGREAVERPHADIEPWPEPRAKCRIRRRDPHPAGLWSWRQRPLSVQGTAERIENAAEPGIRHGQGATLVEGDRATRVRLAAQTRDAARSEPVESRIGHGLGDALVETDHFRRNLPPVARRQCQAIADGHVPAEPVDIDDQAGQPDDPSFQEKRRDVS